MRVCPVCQLKYQGDENRCFVDGTALQEVADPRIGTLLAGRYQIESQLGEGGMAVVYRARQQLVDRPVAIKVMSAHLVRDASLQLYRLRVIEDRNVGSRWQIEFEWMAID